MTEIGLLDFQITEISAAICTIAVIVVSLVAVVLIARRFLK